MALTFTGVAISTFPMYVKFCFPVFIVSAIAWLINGLILQNKPQIITQLALLAINAIAVVRWFT